METDSWHVLHGLSSFPCLLEFLSPPTSLLHIPVFISPGNPTHSPQPNYYYEDISVLSPPCHFTTNFQSLPASLLLCNQSQDVHSRCSTLDCRVSFFPSLQFFTVFFLAWLSQPGEEMDTGAPPPRHGALPPQS